MRIIAGSRKGHRIAAPKGEKTRPTSDFVRETAFNLIGPVDDATVIDLFAGSGALGLEALSRGAARVTFVDSDREACRTINANLDKLGLQGTVVCQDVTRALTGERGTYDLLLADPPYGYERLDRLGPLLRKVLAPGGVLVYQTESKTEPEIEGLGIRTSRKYGSARLTLFEL
ncbi:MAG TPA: 16S rRNA (guanine(966)-N(2))-methyltransferase RsmD [Gaiellaceae bacterium]|jgi:16S rRNA (guanine966-N2)-methyltransferase